jgi:hypothetical protein
MVSIKKGTAVVLKSSFGEKLFLPSVGDEEVWR